MATMKQVAERAGVSTSTVSHVINGTRAVSVDVRERVLGLIDAMGYIPNAMARSLRNDKTHTIGVALPDNGHPYFAELLRGIEDAAFEAGYHVMLCRGHADPERQAVHLRGLIGKRIDGLVLASCTAAAEQALVPLLAGLRVPLVLAGQALPGVAADCIGLDHEATGHAATRHLLELGHRRIACVAAPESEPGSRERVAGYRRALREAGIVPDPAWLLHAEASCAGGHDAALALLALPHPPTALFACSDLMALGALCAAQEAGLALPGQLSVAGGDGLGMAAFATPRLTSVAQPGYAMGRAVAELLVARIGGESGPLRHQRLQGTLVVRQSTAAPR